MLFKKYAVLWIFVLCAIGIALAAVGWQIAAGGALFWPILAVSAAALIFVWLSLQKQSEQQVEKISALICDPYLYANMQKDLIHSSFSLPHTKLVCKLRLIDALMDIGEYTAVPPVLNTINIPPQGFLYIDYLATLISYYFNIGETPKAEEAYKALRASKKAIKSPALLRRIAELELDIQKNLHFQNKDYDLCTTYFHSILESADKPNRLKAYTAYKLGVIAVSDRDKKRARQYFEDVLKYGNKMAVVEQAKILLNFL